jgi:hypothetical protein
MLPRNNNTNDVKKITSINLTEINLRQTLYYYQKIYDSNPTNVLEAIPREECWRFLIDGKEQDKAGIASLETYEQREAGYFASMGIAFSYMLDVAKSQTEINLLDFCSVLHIKSLSEVKTGTHYHRFALDVNAGEYQNSTYEKAANMIAMFQRQVNDVETSNLDKLKLIINLIYSLVGLSPFKDANNRVFVKLLLNYLLISHSFPPTILDNHLDFEKNHSQPDHLINEVITGMKRSLDLASMEPSDSYHKIGLKILKEKTLADYNKTTDLLKEHFPYAMCDNANQLQSLQLFLKDEPKNYQEAMIFVEKVKLELNNRSTQPYDAKQGQDKKIKEIILKIEKYLLHGKDTKWELSLLGGKKFLQDEKTVITVPHKIAEHLQIIKEAKLRESKNQNPNWQVVLDLLVYCGKYAKKWSQSSDELRQQYYGLFSKHKNKKFMLYFGGSEQQINPIWRRHFK